MSKSVWVPGRNEEQSAGHQSLVYVSENASGLGYARGHPAGRQLSNDLPRASPANQPRITRLPAIGTRETYMPSCTRISSVATNPVSDTSGTAGSLLQRGPAIHKSQTTRTRKLTVKQFRELRRLPLPICRRPIASACVLMLPRIYVDCCMF